VATAAATETQEQSQEAAQRMTAIATILRQEMAALHSVLEKQDEALMSLRDEVHLQRQQQQAAQATGRSQGRF